jgi:hypothetical protein
MPWTTPRNWVTGDLVTAALLNQQWRDNINELRYGHRIVADATARAAITDAASGLMIWQQDTNQLLVYDGSVWRGVSYS